MHSTGPLDRILNAAERGATVLTANTRAARQLRLAYDRRQSRRGLSAWRSPDVIAWPGFVGRLWRQLTVESSRSFPVVFTATQERCLWEQVISRHAEANQASALAGLAAEAWALMHDYDLRLSQAAMQASAETAAFQNWTQDFRASLKQNQWMTAAERSSVLCEEIKAGRLKFGAELITIGFDSFTPRQRALLSALAENGAKWANEGISSFQPDSIRALKLNDATAEFRAAASWAHAKLKQDPHQSLAIVIPNIAAVRDGFERELTLQLEPAAMLPGTAPNRAFHISHGRSLAEQPMIHTALLLLRWSVESLRLDEAGVVLRSPFLKRADAERSARAFVDIELRRKNITRLNLRDVERLGTRRNDARFFAPALGKMLSRANHNDLLPRAAGAWVERFDHFLRVFGWPGDRSLTSTEYQVQQRWRELLSDFAQLDSVQGAMNSSEAVAMLARLAEQAVFEPENNGAPVQVLGMLEAAGSRFDAIWIANLDSEHWPQVGSPHPMLPVAEQREARIPHSSPEIDIAFCDRVMRRLLSSADDVVLSFAATDGDRELSPSPALRDVRFGDADELAVPTSIRYGAFSPGAEIIAESEWSPFTSECAPGGTRLLELQAACPFHAFAELRLHAQSLGATVDGLTPPTRGKLVHAAMKFLWDELRTHKRLCSLSPSDLDDVINRSIEAALQESAYLFAADDFQRTLASIERERLRSLIAAWLELEKNRAAFEVLATEEKETVELGGLQLNVRRDRIDKLPDGRCVILDYKNSRVAAKSWEGDRPDAPQLPLYAVSNADSPVAAVAFAQMKAGNLKFVGVQDSRGLLPQANFINSMDLQIATWRIVLEELADEFRSGYAAVDPKNREKTCRTCGLDSLCRIAEHTPEGSNA